MSNDLNNFDDFILDNPSSSKKMKKTDSSDKGKRNEREVVDLLNARFKEFLSTRSEWGMFSRSVGSGARGTLYGNKVLSQSGKDVFASDIACPTNFKFSIESKAGYEKIDIYSIFKDGKVKALDEFLNQAQRDADNCGRKPILTWKKDHKPRLAVVLLKDVEVEMNFNRMIYGNFVFMSFNEFLKFPDSYFFNNC